VKSGAETRRVIQSCGARDYQERLGKELAAIRESEMWRAGAAARGLRPKESAKKSARRAKGTTGRAS